MAVKLFSLWMQLSVHKLSSAGFLHKKQSCMRRGGMTDRPLTHLQGSVLCEKADRSQDPYLSLITALVTRVDSWFLS